MRCQVFEEAVYYADASLPAPPHVGEYIWFSEDGTTRIYFKVESVAHSSGGDVELVAKRVQRPQFHKG
jgi:hypothetical protein